MDPESDGIIASVGGRHFGPYLAHGPHSEFGRRDVALPFRLGIGQGVTDYVFKVSA